MISMVLSILSLWVFQFPVAYVLSDRTSLAQVGIWWSYPVANVVAMLVALGWFATGSWNQKRLLEEAALRDAADTGRLD